MKMKIKKKKCPKHNRPGGIVFILVSILLVLETVKNDSEEFPVQVQCMRQGDWGWCSGMTQSDGMGREVGGGFRMGTHVHPWRIQINV